MTLSATTFAAARAELYPLVFGQTSDFAEAITQYPLGVVTSPVTITAVVHMEAEGDQPVDDPNGARIVRRCEVSIPQPGATIAVAQRKQNRDLFLIRGEIWSAERIVRRTPYRVRLRCVRSEAGATAKTRL